MAYLPQQSLEVDQAALAEAQRERLRLSELGLGPETLSRRAVDKRIAHHQHNVKALRQLIAERKAQVLGTGREVAAIVKRVA